MVGCHCEVCSSTDFRDHRLRTSAMVEVELDGCGGDEDRKVVRIIIDAGHDFRYQMLRERVERIDAILLTHEHKDHVGGIDDVRAFNYWTQKPVDIYCAQRVADVIRKDFDYAFPDLKKHYPGVPQIELHIIDNDSFEVKGVKVEPIKVMHYKLPVLGYRLGGLCYITDANYVTEEVVQKIKGCEVLVINALRREPHISHFTLTEALELIRQVEPKKAVITHVSHQMGLYDDVQGELPDGVVFGYDGMKIEVVQDKE